MTLTLGLAAVPCAAQEDFVIDLFRPRLEVGFDSVGETDFTDLTGERFSQGTLTFSANIPIGKTHLKEDSPLLGYQFFAETYATSSTTEISFLEDDPRLYTGGVRFTGVALSQGLNLFIGSLGASFAEEEDTVDDLQMRLAAFGIGTYRTSENFWLGYGAAFTHEYGEGLALPLVGFYWKINDRWSLGSLVPFFTRATYVVNKRLQLHLQASVAGERYRFSNEPESDSDIPPFPGEPEDLRLKVVEGRLGTELEFIASERISILGQIGVNGGRRLQFTDSDDDDILDEEIDPSGYLRFFVRTTFGKSLVNRITQ